MRAHEIVLNIPITINMPEEPAVEEPVDCTTVATTNEPTPVADTDAEPISDRTGVMVPPLQQKQELLKRAVGVNNVYDRNNTPDTLDIIRNLAGLE